MEKKLIHDLDLKGSKRIAITDNSTVYKLKDGSILKIINPNIIEIKK